jgi:hypothetical protein
MGIRTARDPVAKTRSESKITALDFAQFLGNGETLASVGAVAITPTGGSPLGGSHLSSAGTAIVGTTIEAVMQNGAAPQVVTADATADELTFSGVHGWPADVPVQLIGHCLPRGKFLHRASGSYVDGWFRDDRVYYLRAGSTGAKCGLAECLGGPAIDITQAEAGTLEIGINYSVVVPATTSSSPAQVIEGEFILKVRS